MPSITSLIHIAVAVFCFTCNTPYFPLVPTFIFIYLGAYGLASRARSVSTIPSLLPHLYAHNYIRTYIGRRHIHLELISLVVTYHSTLMYPYISSPGSVVRTNGFEVASSLVVDHDELADTVCSSGDNDMHSICMCMVQGMRDAGNRLV